MGVYSSVVYTLMETYTGAVMDAKAAEGERIYASIEAFSLD